MHHVKPFRLLYIRVLCSHRICPVKLQAELRTQQQAEHIARAAHALERMVKQNTVGDVAMDMRVSYIPSLPPNLVPHFVDMLHVEC